MHIPKTAGTSLRAWLAEQYHARDVMPLRWPITPAHPPTELPRPIAEYAEIGRFSLISEHLGANVWGLVRQTHLGIVILREPRDRLLSYYWNIRTKDESLLAGAPPVWKELWTRARAMGVAEFLTDPPPSVRKRFINAQVRQMATNLADLSPASEDLDLALETMGQMGVVGTTELLASTVRVLCDRAGWAPPESLPRFAPTEGRPRLEDLDEPDLAALDHATRLDQRLYRAAMLRLDTDLAALLAREPDPTQTTSSAPGENPAPPPAQSGG
ncbi:MAG: hypothetical protein ACI89L_002630 [Phycisphaerales bacterium]|jgi:hypothetical protein